jgi:predicted permease
VGGLARPVIGIIATVLVLVLPIPLSPDQKQLFLLFALLPPALLNYQMAPQASAQQVSGLVFFGTLMSLAYIVLAMPIIFATASQSGSLTTRMLGQLTGVLP